MSDKLIEAILRYTENAVQFGVEQLPEIAEQYLQLCLINHVGWLMVDMIALFACIYVIKRLIEFMKDPYNSEMGGVGIFLIVCIIIIISINIIYHTSNIMAIKYMPKGYLIRELINKQGK
jgi:hypothetical protein